MALSAADLTHPAGELTAEMFPGETLSTNVSSWITEAQGKTDDEDAQEAWVYYRAYHAVFLRLSNAPANVEVEGEGRQQHLVTQIQHFRSLRDEKLDLYYAITASEPTQQNWAVVRSRR